MSSECVFCRIVAGTEPANIRMAGPATVVFDPIGPHAPGHVLVVPRLHVVDAIAYPAMTATVMQAAAEYAFLQAVGPCNIITSVGAEATQTVFHLHVHVVPRGTDDGLPSGWPWRQ